MKRYKWLAVVLAVAMMLGMMPALAGATNSGLVAYWSFDELVGDKVPDLLGNGNDGTLHGSARLDTENIAPVTGNIASLYLDGSIGTYVSVAHSETLAITSEITVAAWVRAETLESGRFYTVAGKWNDRSGNLRAYLLGIRDGHPRFYISRDGNDFPSAHSSTKLTTGEFYHLAGTYDGSYLRIYVNGVEMGSTHLADDPSISSNLEDLLMGADRAGGGNGRFFKGNIDEVAIFNRALSADEIGTLYSPPTVTWLPPISLDDFTLNENATLPIKFALDVGCLPGVELKVNGVPIELEYSEDEGQYLGLFRPAGPDGYTAVVSYLGCPLGTKTFTVYEVAPQGRGRNK